jgi:serine/threonine protein kinase
MDAKSPRWRQITPSQHAWEADALDYLRNQLPDREPYKAWANFEFTSPEGRVYEVDALVITSSGIFLIEIKSRPGHVTGDSATWRWSNERNSITVDNPLRLANYKAKVLKSLIQSSRPWRQRKGGDFFVESLVFLSDPALTTQLAADGRTNIVVRDRTPDDKAAGPGIKGLLGYFQAYSPPYRHSKPGADLAKAISDSLEAAGVRESQKSRQVGPWIIDRVAIDEGPGYQDFIGRFRTIDSIVRRVRIFPTPANMPREARLTLLKAVQREFQLLNGVQHPAIDVPKTLEEHETGPALVYDHYGDSQRLDLYLAERGAALTVDAKLSLLRQISETLAYAHGRRLVHRGLTPRSILVLDPGSGTPRIKILNWQTIGLSQDGDVTSRPASEVTTLRLNERVGDTSAAFVAPEFYAGVAVKGEALDVFSLGAIAFLIFAGRSAARSQSELAALVASTDGLRLDANVDGVPKSLADLVREATRPLVEDRLESAGEFVLFLTDVESELTAPEPEVTVDPLDARKAERLAGGYSVVARLGAGATAIGLAVESDDGLFAGREIVAKVALSEDHAERLHVEADVLKSLRHENIVELLGTTSIGGHTTLLLSSAGKSTLDQILRADGRLSLDQLERFGNDLLEAVRYLERVGIAHRDIKPANLGVTEVGPRREQHLMLFDFSLARTPADAVRAGTPPYLEPFLSVNERPWDLHAERYAVAMTLYEMATAALPVWGDGHSDPGMTVGEVSLEADLLPAECRASLETFFRKALKRSFKDRFSTAEDMQRAWSRAISGAPATTLPNTRIEADARLLPLDGVGRARTDSFGVDSATTLETLLSQLDLSARATNALDRMSLLTVRDLLTSRVSFVSTKGIGHHVKVEIREARRRLQESFPAVNIVAEKPSEPMLAAARMSVEILAESLVPVMKRANSREPVFVRAFLGLDDHEGLSSWPTNTDVARVLGVTPGRIAQVIPDARQSWGELDTITALRSRIVQALKEQSYVAGLDQLVDLVLAECGSEASPLRRRRYSRAIVRALVEVETHCPDPRFVLRQKDGRMAIASLDGLSIRAEADGAVPIEPVPTDVEVADEAAQESLRRAEERLTMAFALGDIADRLVGEVEVVEPGLALARLAAVAPVAEDGALPDYRVFRLASASSSRSELYPRGMEARRALRLSRSSLAGIAGISVDELRSRVSARYPDAQRLPDRPDLDDLLREVGIELEWIHERSMFVKPVDTTGLTSFTHTSLAPSSRLAAGAAEAAGFEATLKRSRDQGGFLALVVSTQRYERAVLALRSPELTVIDFDLLFVRALRFEAQQEEIPWDAVVQADREGRDGSNWTYFGKLVDAAILSVQRLVDGAGPQILVTHPGLMARYKRTELIDHLRDAAGSSASPIHTAWVLIASSEQTSAPTIDGEPVRITSPNQSARIPTGWIEVTRSAQHESEHAMGSIQPGEALRGRTEAANHD